MFYIALYDSSGSLANPVDFSDYEKAETLKEARIIFENWVKEVGKYSEIQNASAYVYPETSLDYESHYFVVGNRGGINLHKSI